METFCEAFPTTFQQPESECNQITFTKCTRSVWHFLSNVVYQQASFTTWVLEAGSYYTSPTPTVWNDPGVGV